jgi:LacI family transcriptional regulator
LRGYRDALEKFHIEFQAQDVLSPALSAEEGSWVMEQFLSKNVPFDAVFGFTETALLGAKSAIQKRGLHIPEDVALCCMSGTALATLVHPQLTAVEQPIEKMAQECCRLLLEHIADRNRNTEEMSLRGETVMREST